MNGFEKNARVCFIGDSITHNNGYVAHIVAYYRENLPERRVKFYNCGVSGGNLGTVFSNFEGDIMRHNPTHAVIMIGINDSNRNALTELPKNERYAVLKNAYDEYKKNLEKLYNMLKLRGVEVILCTPTPYFEYTESEVEPLHGGYALMLGYAEFVRAFAKEKGIKLCDYHDYITEASQTEVLVNPDHVHPNPDGHFHMAKCFLDFQGFEISESREIPDYLDEWRDTVSKVRDIWATEHHVIKDRSLNSEECVKKAEWFIENGENNRYKEYFTSLCEKYILQKPMQADLEKKADEFMDSLYEK